MDAPDSHLSAVSTPTFASWWRLIWLAVLLLCVGALSGVWGNNAKTARAAYLTQSLRIAPLVVYIDAQGALSKSDSATATLELRFKVDENEAEKLSSGQAVVVAVDAFQGRLFVGQLLLRQQDAAARSGNSIRTGVIRIANAQGLLQEGMNATAKIQLTKVDIAFLVPNAALDFAALDQAFRRPSAGGTGRVLLLRGGKPQLRTIVLGLSDGKETEVLSGNLFEEDEVIIGVDKSHTLGSPGH